MNFVKRLGLIIAVTLAMDAFIIAPAFPQLNEANTLIKKVSELSRAGKFAEAVPLTQRLVAVAEKTFGPNHQLVAIAISDLAMLYVKLDRYADAEPLYKRALAFPDDLEVAGFLDRLAGLYLEHRRYADAEPIYKRVLAIREKLRGPNHPDVAASLNNLAAVYENQGRHGDAEPLYKRAQAIDGKAGNRQDAATSSDDPQVREMGILVQKIKELKKAGKFAEAVPLARRALAIVEKAAGPDDPAVADVLDSLAQLYNNQGRSADAEPLLKRSLAIREKALGPGHPDVAESLNNLAELYEKQGRNADAVPLRKRALAINEKARDPNHPDPASIDNRELREAATLMVKAAELYQAGKFAEAVPLTQRALAITEKMLGPNDPGVAMLLSRLAMLYVQLGRYADAEPLYKRAVAIADDLDVVESLNGLADLYNDHGRYADAEPIYKRSLAIREKALGPDHPDVATSLNDLAVLYVQLGRYADAEPLHKRALAIREGAHDPDRPAVATSLHNLAQLYDHQGRYADAEALFKRALAIFEKARDPDHTSVASALNSLAAFYVDQGRYADAEPLHRRALAIREKVLSPDHPDVAQSLNNLAELYRAQRRYADVEPLYKRALAIQEKARGSNHPEVAISLSNLASLYVQLGRYADAEPLFKRSLAIEEKALGADHPGVARSLNNLAYLYDEQRRYADAEPLLKRSLAINEKAFGPNHPDVATSLDNLAACYNHQGRSADVERLLKQSLAIREKVLSPDHPDVAESLNNLAALYDHQGRYADALPLVQKTIASVRAIRSVAVPVLFGAQDKGLISAAKARDDALDVVQRASQTAAAAAVNKLAVRLRAGSDRLAQLVRKDQDLAAETETLDKAIVAAVSKEPGQRDATNEQRIRDRLAAIATERQALEKVFAAEFPDYAALSNPQPLTVKDIQGLLSGDEALVLFASGGEETYVFAVTRKAVASKVVRLGTAALAEKVAAFRRGLDVEALRQSAQGGKPVLFDLGLANELYAALIGPVEEVIKDSRHLLVVPTGALTSLPFHLLVTDKPTTAIPELKDIGSYRDAAWLIKRQAVSVLPALASLKALRQVAGRDQGAKPMVGFGDPVFDPAERAKALAERRARVAVTRGYGDFWQRTSIDRAKLVRSLPSLLDTADELKAVAGKLGAGAGDVHLGNDASETVVKRMALTDYRVVYFATHGLVAGDVAGLGEPSLALTQPKQPTELDDGLLTASEVAQLKLNADWVVLSACNTAAGDKPGAEALSGLARAFFYAGARALLVSHWSVDSEAATRLTTSTFAIMKADPKLGRAEALRQAMLAYMNDGSGTLDAYPGLWGPFSVVGEGGAVQALPVSAPLRAGQAGTAAVTANVNLRSGPGIAPALAQEPAPNATPQGGPATQAPSAPAPLRADQAGSAGVTANVSLDSGPAIAPALAQERVADATPQGGPATQAPPAPTQLRAGRARTAAAIANVNLRSGPGTDSDVIATIPAGSTVRVASCSDDWCEVTWDGRSGYAIARNLSLGAPQQAGPYGPGPRTGYAGGYGPPPPAGYVAAALLGRLLAGAYGPTHYGPRVSYGPGWGWHRRRW
jgi:tetratricopeptide (TPR) repeat protein/uncharacterized protein YraI